MNKIVYFFKRIGKIDYSRFWKVFWEIQKESKKNPISLAFDLLKCGIKYNAGYMDYKIAKMYKLNKEQRASTITRGISNEIVKTYNDKAYWHYFDNKATFNTIFADYIKRDWCLIGKNCDKFDLENFLKKHKRLMYKPLEGSSGQGIQLIEANQWENDIDSFYENIKLKGNAILEEIVIQHSKLEKLNSSSVNTVRISTLNGPKKNGIVYAFLRIGNGKVMDNVDCGGMAARVDIDSGKLISVAADKQGNIFEYHPISKVKIEGFEIPHWEEAKKICLEAAKKIPQMRFIAWDVAITENGPVFIEGNSFPSHAVPQFAAHYKDGIGILREFREFIDI